MSVLTLSATTRCNFSCMHCIKKGAKIQDIDLNLLDKILKQASKYGFNSIHITGGEPYVHKKFKKLIETIEQHKYYFSIGSNGYNFEKYKFIIEKPFFTKFSTSLDGVEKTHDKIRKKGSFKKVIKFIDFCSKNNIKINVVMVLNKINKNEMKKVIEILKNKKINYLYFAGIIRTKYNRDISLSDKKKYELYLNYKKLKNIYKKIPIGYTASLYRGNNIIEMCSSIGFSSPMINTYGDLVFCCDTLGEGAAIGSLKEKSFGELYKKGIDFSAALKKTRIIDIEKNEKCYGFNSCQFCNHYLKEILKY